MSYFVYGYTFVASSVDPPIGGLLTAAYVQSDIIVNVTWGKDTVLKLPNGVECDTSSSVSRFLARAYPKQQLYGASDLDRVEVDHWISYSIGPMVCRQEFRETILYLNQVLGTRTYFVSNSLTIADFAVFGALYTNPQWNALVQTETKITENVSRWFEFIKSLDQVQSVLATVPDIVKAKPVAELTSSGRKEEGKFVELPGAEMGKVVVRFPPEASGYLHIGHAKAALLNQYYQETFNGKLIMRFDDTNPAKEKVDFEKVILEDLEMLQIKPDQFTHTSQYFDVMLEMCEKLIKEDKAYVDDTAPELMKEEREQRKKSKNWNNSCEENMRLWTEMKKGTDVGQKCCVRAKISMDSHNGCMRDPTIYRCKNEPHPRTGTQYKVYPTYDFACPIVDSIEGVTHCLRTTEYHDRDDQFYWFIDTLGLRKPHIWSYSRLNMTNTVLSKRKLTWFVDENLVDGWDDPRFPTVRGVLRRGMTVEALKQFIIAQGGSRSVVVMEWDKIWAINKKIIDPIAARYTAVEKQGAVRVCVSGVQEEPLSVAKHPKNADIGTKTVWTSPTILIDAADAEVLKEGENTTFINWGNLLIKKITRDNGKIVCIDAEPNLTDTDFKKTVKMTWLAETPRSPTIPCRCVYFDNIISKAVLGKDDDFKQFIAHETKVEVEMLGDPELANLRESDVIQIQRKGFFRVERAYTPFSRYSSVEGPVVLYFIPDGHSKALPTAGAPTPLAMGANAKAQEATRTANSVLPNTVASSGDSASDLNSKIVQQGDKVRVLKEQKATKDTITAEVKALLALKADYKAATGSDWKPGVAPVAAPIPVSVLPAGNSASDLNNKIVQQGDKVRVLKEQKATKDAITAEVKTLLALKADYKAATGSDWKPGVAPVTAPTPVSVLPAGNSASDLNNKIVQQGDKVRVLKEQKATKDAITAEVKTLLALKADYKAATGSDWKPGSEPTGVSKPVEPAENTSSNELNNKIIQQGDRVRALKEQKATKDAISAEVKALLELKSEFKKATGGEWKPIAHVPTKAPEPVVSCILSSSARDVLLAKIAEQGNVVRKVKGDKAAKNIVDSEVQSLLALKGEFKSVTGEDWKPNLQPQTVSTDSTPVAMTADIISSKIVAQGEKVRQLKAEKAAKTAVDVEVKTLLSLKAEFKALAGKEWKPEAAAAKSVAASADAVSECAPDMSVSGDNEQSGLAQKIADQGNKVRDLKNGKAAKELIDESVKALLDLKTQYKQLAGVEYAVPGARAPKKKEAKEKPAPQAKKAPTVDKAVGDTNLDGPKKITRLGLEASKEDNLPDWYSQVITKGELIEYYDVSGCYILRPWSFAIWEAIQSFVDREIKLLGVQNCYFPIFVSKAALEKEKTHIADFAPEVAWVTKSGETDLAEHIAVRPTSETGMYPAYAKWVQSYRDLPIKLNQWNNVVRWEFKHPQPFLRTREFLWQEGHSAFATRKEAEEEVLQILDIYARVYTDLLAIPVVKGRKTEKEKFAGGNFTTTVEAFVSASGRAIQGATSHHLGQNFAKMFEIVFDDPETQEKQYVFQNSWGLTTRTIGVMIMIHADNQGLVLPPRVASIQAVIVPCGLTASLPAPDKQALMASCHELEAALRGAGVRVHGDYRDNYSPGWKFNHWELKGVPIRVELGPKDLKQGQLVAVRRDSGEKITLRRDTAVADVGQLLDKIHFSMLDKAARDLDTHKVVCKDWSEFCAHLDNKRIMLSPFCGEAACEDRIKQDSARDDAEAEAGAPAMGAKSLCVPFDQPAEIKPTDKCIHTACSNKPKKYTLFGRSY